MTGGCVREGGRGQAPQLLGLLLLLDGCHGGIRGDAIGSAKPQPNQTKITVNKRPPSASQCKLPCFGFDRGGMEAGGAPELLLRQALLLLPLLVLPLVRPPAARGRGPGRTPIPVKFVVPQWV